MRAYANMNAENERGKIEMLFFKEKKDSSFWLKCRCDLYIYLFLLLNELYEINEMSIEIFFV